jgi:Na+-translocating ferredoxin:NAD+ oxidoreductase subunit G
MSNKFYPIFFLTIVVLISVAILMGLNVITEPRIIAAQEAELRQLLERTYTDMTDFTFEDDVYIIQKEGENIGYSFVTIGKGYGGNIRILISLESDFNIKNISIMSQTETPGLGDRILSPAFTEMFVGLEADEVALRSAGGEIDAITGATVSSKAVTEAVRQAMIEKIQNIK